MKGREVKFAKYADPMFDKKEGRINMMSFHQPKFDKIKMTRTKLIEILKKNKEAHASEFEEALKGYQKAFLDRAENLVVVIAEAIKAGERVTFSEDFNLEVPHSYVKDYEATITMLEHHEAEQVELSLQEFNAFVRDEWEWKGYHASTVANYSGPAGPAGPTGSLGSTGPVGRYRAAHVQRVS